MATPTWLEPPTEWRNAMPVAEWRYSEDEARDPHGMWTTGGSFTAKAQSILEALPPAFVYSSNDKPVEGASEFLVKIQAAKEDDPMFDTFTKAVSAWTDGRYADYARMSDALTKGKDEFDKVSKEVVEKSFASIGSAVPPSTLHVAQQNVLALTRAVLASPEKDVTVYRGIATPSGHPIPELEQATVGSVIQSAGLRSFSYSQQVAGDFAHSFDEDNAAHKYVIQLEGPAHGVNLSALSMSSKEQEFITGGKFEVTKVETGHISRYPAQVKILHVKQLGVYAPAAGVR
jgi:hypothetical protein